MMTFDMESAKEALNELTGKAEELLSNPDKVEKLLQAMENKLKELPAVGTALSRLPLMISMIRAYIRREYTAVSPKVIVTMLCAILYLLKGKDLIPDKTPVLGYADDIAVFTAAFAICQTELDAYSQWRGEDKQAK